MQDYQNWIINRLETDLQASRTETEALRQKLETRDERIRQLELQVTRFELQQEMKSDEETPKSLADRFDPVTIGQMADKIAPIAMLVGDIFRSTKSVPVQPSAVAAPIQMAFHPYSYDESVPSIHQSDSQQSLPRG